jgi:hypothetical protein
MDERLCKKITIKEFSVNGVKYEIRLTFCPRGTMPDSPPPDLVVQAYSQDGKPANGFSCRVTLDVFEDLHNRHFRSLSSEDLGKFASQSAAIKVFCMMVEDYIRDDREKEFRKLTLNGEPA